MTGHLPAVPCIRAAASAIPLALSRREMSVLASLILVLALFQALQSQALLLRRVFLAARPLSPNIRQGAGEVLFIGPVRVTLRAGGTAHGQWPSNSSLPA